MKQTVKSILNEIDDPLVIYTTVVSIIDPKVLTQLTTCSNIHVRRAIACIPWIPWKILSKLITDEDVVVRKFIALHPQCPYKQLVQYTGDKSNSVVVAAKQALLRKKTQAQYECVRKLLSKTLNR